MALAAIPVLPAAPPAPPIFRFADGPPPNDVWAPGMDADPLLQVDADEPFAAYAACLPWTQHPPLPAQPTHMRCRYSWVHLVLHGCLHSTDVALLDQQRAFLRYDLPSKLSDVWLCVSAAMDLDTPMIHTGKLIKVVLEAAKLCESDPRLLLSLADTAEAQDAPVNGLVASRWQLVITTRALVHKPEDSLFHEAWLLWRCRDRFTQAARAADVSPFRILSESARLKVESESALLAPFLAVAAPNFGTIATQVAAEMKSWTIPLEMLEFPDDPFLVLKDASQLQRYLSGTDAERQAAFVARLDTVLVHYPAIHLVLLKHERGKDILSRGSLLQQLVGAHLPHSYDPFCVPTMEILNDRDEHGLAQQLQGIGTGNAEQDCRDGFRPVSESSAVEDHGTARPPFVLSRQVRRRRRVNHWFFCMGGEARN